MNNHSNTELIDEDEVRAALRLGRPDGEAFSTAVHALIDARSSTENLVELKRRPGTEDRTEDRTATNDWQAAASIAPIQLLLGVTGGSSPNVSFGALSLVNKFLAVLAMPFACFLMVGLTLSGMRRVRVAQRNQTALDVDQIADQEKLVAAMKAWWRRHGWIAGVIYVAALASQFIWTTPFLILLFGSGVAAVSMVVHLAKENLADRRAIGGILENGLSSIGQISVMLPFWGIGEHWLDQHLVAAVLTGGMFLIMAVTGPPNFQKNAPTGRKRKLASRANITLWLAFGVWACLMGLMAYWLDSMVLLWSIPAVATILAAGPWIRKAGRQVAFIYWIVMLTVGCIAVGFLTQTLWRPLSPADVKNYVESFQPQPHFRWHSLDAPAVWLEESGIEYDKTKLREHFEQALKDEKMSRPFMLKLGVRTGLIDAKDLVDTEDVVKWRKSLLNRKRVDMPVKLERYYYAIAAIAADTDLNESDRDRLASRLMANWEYICKREEEERVLELEDALMVTELLERVDRPVDAERRTKDVHRWLAKMQLTDPQFFSRAGGFRKYLKLNHCESGSTIAALQLIDRYGAPESIDWVALRSYLRPFSLDHFLIHQGIETKVSRERLNQLADAPRPTMVGYLRKEVPLCLSILLVVLAVYATLSAPLPEPTKKNG